MIVISQSLSLAPSRDVLLDTPIFGWDNVVVSQNVSASSEADGFPASHIANPSTALRWKAARTATDEELVIITNTIDEIDYIGIAGHNLGSAQVPVTVEGATEEFGSPVAPEWSEITSFIPADDSPILVRFAPTSYSHLRLRFSPAAEAPQIGVVYAGKLLIAERGTSVDHVPINLGWRTDVVSGRSESGQFLGRIILGETRQTGFSLQHMRPGWFRSTMVPFLKAAQEAPFFFAWRPADLPRDVGYCWLTSDPQPQISFDTGRFSIELQLEGVA